MYDPVTGDDVVDVLDQIDPSLLKQKCLDHGFVNLLDVMPRLVPSAHPTCDFALADAARISYQKGTRKVNEDKGLIDNLIRNQHTSPIEMGELKFHIRLPIFVMRQHVRHRTASLNEESARYSVLASDFYVPDPKDWAMNTASDKQATVKYVIDEEVANTLYRWITEHNEEAYALYTKLLEGGDDDDAQLDYGLPPIAREQARMVLGTNIYTQCIWKCDLKNLLHYLRLRTDAHAQYEIRVFADAIARAVQACFPVAWQSFKDNFIDGVNFSKTEMGVVCEVFSAMFDGMVQRPANYMKSLGWTKRRGEEFLKKLYKIPALSPEFHTKLKDYYFGLYAKA
jgi:thymidylate synthase (FAD)